MSIDARSLISLLLTDFPVEPTLHIEVMRSRTYLFFMSYINYCNGAHVLMFFKIKQKDRQAVQTLYNPPLIYCCLIHIMVFRAYTASGVHFCILSVGFHWCLESEHNWSSFHFPLRCLGSLKGKVSTWGLVFPLAPGSKAMLVVSFSSLCDLGGCRITTLGDLVHQCPAWKCVVSTIFHCVGGSVRCYSLSRMFMTSGYRTLIIRLNKQCPLNLIFPHSDVVLFAAVAIFYWVSYETHCLGTEESPLYAVKQYLSLFSCLLIFRST
ncbi:hypothetical protein FKM82_011385 [Ascaphus truei]